jgi:hypothetical protein
MRILELKVDSIIRYGEITVEFSPIGENTTVNVVER